MSARRSMGLCSTCCATGVRRCILREHCDARSTPAQVDLPAQWFNMLKAKCMTAWKGWAQRQIQTRSLMRSIATRIARRTEVIVLQSGVATSRTRVSTWACGASLDACRRLEMLWASASACRTANTPQTSCDPPAQRCAEWAAAAHFHGWKHQVQSQMKRREETIRRCLQRMRFGAMAIVMDQWRQLWQKQDAIAIWQRRKPWRAAAASAPAAHGSRGDDCCESAALKADVAELRRSLDLTRRELKAISFAAAKRYELAIVR